MNRLVNTMYPIDFENTPSTLLHRLFELFEFLNSLAGPAVESPSRLLARFPGERAEVILAADMHPSATERRTALSALVRHDERVQES